MSLSTTLGGFGVVEYAGTLSLTRIGFRLSARHASYAALAAVGGTLLFAIGMAGGGMDFALLGTAGSYLALFGLVIPFADNEPVGWEISPGSITQKRMILGRFRAREHGFSVEQLQLVHQEWVGWRGAPAGGCSDLLRFWTREWGYVEIKSRDTDRTRLPQGGAGDADGAEITTALPTGFALGPRDPLTVVGKTEVWTGPASVPRDILTLAYLVQDALRRPLVVVVETRGRPSDD